MSKKPGHLYEFGPFLLDTGQHALFRDGQPVALTPKTYDALVLLVENSGRMMFKDELMGALWPNSFVEESNLTQQISMIRKALGETSYIVTVPGRGYRFAAPVFDRSQAVEPEAVPVEKSLPESRPNWMPYAAAAVVVIAVAGFFMFRQRSTVTRPSTVPRSLAILPFQSLREDPKSDFLGFSLADAVITKLDYVSSVTVRPSSAIEKYRHKPIDLHKIAADLHVDTLLTGNFLRDGDDIRITSQLVDINTENIIWKGTFDLKYNKLLTVQDSVAQQIVKGLALSLSPVEAEHLRPGKPVDPRAYEFYLRGVDLYARNDFPMAIKMLETSAEIDPNYALTWANLGRAHTANASFELAGRDGYGAAQNAYQKALSIEPTQIEAQIYMANRFTDTGRVESAVPLLRNVLKANPSYAEAHWELGYAYRFAGMLKESVEECERARQLDPGVKLSTSTLTAYLYLGQYDKFLATLPPDDSAFIVFYRGFGEYYRKNLAQAATDFDRAFKMHPSLLHVRVGKALSDSIADRKPAAIQTLHEIEKVVSERGVGDPEGIYKVAQAYAIAGDKASALRVLRLSIENGFFSFPYLASDTLLESLRGNQEFAKLLDAARTRHEAFKRTFFP